MECQFIRSSPRSHALQAGRSGAGCIHFAEALGDCLDSLWYAMNSPSEPDEMDLSKKEILGQFLALGKSVSEKVLSASDNATETIVNGWGPDCMFIPDLHTTYS